MHLQNSILGWIPIQYLTLDQSRPWCFAIEKEYRLRSGAPIWAHNQNGATIFMSTHTLKVAEDICDRIGIIHKGSLIATGTTDDLKQIANAGTSDLEQVFINLTQN